MMPSDSLIFITHWRTFVDMQHAIDLVSSRIAATPDPGLEVVRAVLLKSRSLLIQQIIKSPIWKTFDGLGELKNCLLD